MEFLYNTAIGKGSRPLFGIFIYTLHMMPHNGFLNSCPDENINAPILIKVV